MKFLLFAALASFGFGLAAQDPFQDVVVESQAVSGAVHMLHAVGGNIGLCVGEDGVLMVDSQFAPLEEKNRAAIAALSKEKPKYLINTHWHGDHTGGNAGFGVDALIVAQDNVRKRLRSGGNGKEPAPAAALPDITFNEELSFYFNGEQIQLIHLPAGHTDGDCIVIFHDSKVVHLGDHLFRGMFPFIDLASGGSVRGYIKNIAFILDNVPPDWKLIPGHGTLANHEDLVDFLAMLQQTSAVVEKRIAAGATRKQVIAEGLPSQWDSWSWEFISTSTWLETLYDSLVVKVD